MTKRQLIDALEKCPLPDDTEVLKSHWESVDDCTGWDVETSIYSVEKGTRTETVGRSKHIERPVIIL